MTSEQFVYWLQGFIELNGGKLPTKEQWASIEDHLKTVFHKVTPTVPYPNITSPYIVNPASPVSPLPPNTIIC